MTDSDQRVGVVFVSHSEQIATGLVALARQMAPTVQLEAAGGTDGGGIGTSFDRVRSAVEHADSDAGVVVLCDLGSAILTAETVREFLDVPLRKRVRIADAPIVEGGVAAAVAAEAGGQLEEVLASAQSAGGPQPSRGGYSSGEGQPSGEMSPPSGSPAYRRRVEFTNPDGLHARPAAMFVRLATSFDAAVTINGKDAKSLLGLMSLGLGPGAFAEIVSVDESGRAAVDALADLVESGFAG